jgi:hypothetical protein
MRAFFVEAINKTKGMRLYTKTVKAEIKRPTHKRYEKP